MSTSRFAACIDGKCYCSTIEMSSLVGIKVSEEITTHCGGPEHSHHARYTWIPLVYAESRNQVALTYIRATTRRHEDLKQCHPALPKQGG